MAKKPAPADPESPGRNLSPVDPTERALYLGAHLFYYGESLAGGAPVAPKVAILIGLYPANPADYQPGIGAVLKLVMFDPDFGVQFVMVEQANQGIDAGQWSWNLNFPG